MQVKIYTDGSSLGNPGPGGFAAIIKFGSEEKIVKGNDPDTTNNRMEMAGIIGGLHWVTKNLDVDSCTVYSDSRLVIQTMRDGWKRKKNVDLWAKMDAVVGKFSAIDWQWVKGHAGHKENEAADRIAVEQAKKAQSKN